MEGMRGIILSVNLSVEKGQKKHNVGHCIVREGHGLEQDGHAGPWHRQVSLLGRESIEKIREKGLDVQYGDFAENLTTQGIILHTLPVGTTLKVGEKVILKVTQIGKVCHERCAIYYQVGDCVMPREGIFAEVIVGGEVMVGDTLEIKETA